MMILLALTLPALFMAKSKRYCLHRLAGFHLSLEISLICIVGVLAGFVEWAVRLVYSTNCGFFDNFYQRYFPAIPTEYYPAITALVNVAVLALQFGSWYYLVTTFGEVFEMGVIGFVKERSILFRFGGRFKQWCRRCRERFDEEILHVDLGGKTEKTIRKLLLINFIILAVACTMWTLGYIALIFYTIALYFLLKKYMNKIQEQYRQLFIATRSIADGNLQTEFDSDWGVFESYKQELARIQNGFKAAVDKEVRSQKMKTELITNVSHDLKTPLTAITTYIELLEDESISPEQRKEYLSVLKRKSERLKYLIEDLFEVSKASSGNITFHPVDVDICNLIRQVYLEYEDRVEEAELIFRFRLPEEKVVLKLDSQKTYRVFENLYTNIIKYAMHHTRVYVNAEKTEKGIAIELKNMSATELDIAPEELTERFVRGDSSRNTEGSGLGISIAKSLTELMNGSFELIVDGDLFKVVLTFPLYGKAAVPTEYQVPPQDHMLPQHRDSKMRDSKMLGSLASGLQSAGSYAAGIGQDVAETTGRMVRRAGRFAYHVRQAAKQVKEEEALGLAADSAEEGPRKIRQQTKAGSPPGMQQENH